MKPLTGVRVIELGTMIAAPSACCMLADLGAEIIKVEPPNGEIGRQIGGIRGDTSVMFESFNRGKRSVVLNLKKEADRRSLHEFVRFSDMFVTNLRPKFLTDIGLNPDSLRSNYPQVVAGVVTTFGLNEEKSNVAGGDVLAQAESGIPYYTGDPDGPPVLNLGAPADAAAATHLAVGLLAAYIRRVRSGDGALVDLSILDAYMSTDPTILPMVAVDGGRAEPVRSGSWHPTIGPHGVVRGVNGWVVISVFGSGPSSHWPRFARAIGRPDLADDPGLNSDQQRIQARDFLCDAIESWLQEVGDDERAVETLRDAGVTAARVLSPSEALFDSRSERRNVHAMRETTEGPMRLMGGAHGFGKRITGETFDSVAPKLGRDTRDVFEEILGYIPEDAGVVDVPESRDH